MAHTEMRDPFKRLQPPAYVYKLRSTQMCLVFLGFGLLMVSTTAYAEGLSAPILLLAIVATLLAGAVLAVASTGHDLLNGWARLAFAGSFRLFAALSALPALVALA